MKELFNDAITKVNNKLLAVNKILNNISKINNNLYELVVDYCNNVENFNYEPYDLKYPYYGMKDEIMCIVNVINHLIALSKAFKEINYVNNDFELALKDLIDEEKNFLITYGMIFFEPFAWENWQEFATSKLKNRHELANAVLLSISLVQAENPEELLDNFYNTELLSYEVRTDIMDFIATNHIEQASINIYFNQKIVQNMALML